MSIFFKPQDGVAGDFIPFYWQGEYHLFYLKDYRDPQGHGEGTPWFHLGTRDFRRFTDYGEALPRGSRDAQDLYVFTGCALEHNNLFHIFYTGHNPHFRAAGKPEQAVMHATSPDLISWTKDPANPILFADFDAYEPHDWRDPFVFWNDTAGEWWMLLAARIKSGPSQRRGITALATSKDLAAWEIRPPFWTPGLYFTHECPDMFRMGEWWYLVYSTFTERHITHYRMSRTLDGPWVAPANDSFDGRAFYAAKTASDGRRRFAFGWNPTRTGETDTGAWNWGGHLVVHEVFQQPDGSLTVDAPPEVAAAFGRAQPLEPQPQMGAWQINHDSLSVSAPDSFAWCSLGDMPDPCMIETTIRWQAGTRGIGLALRTDATLDQGYLLRLEPGRGQFVLDRFPRPGDEPPVIARPARLAESGGAHLRVLVEDSAIVAYLNHEVALSARGYNHRANRGAGLFVSEGQAAFRETRITTP